VTEFAWFNSIYRRWADIPVFGVWSWLHRSILDLCNARHRWLETVEEPCDSTAIIIGILRHGASSDIVAEVDQCSVDNMDETSMCVLGLGLLWLLIDPIRKFCFIIIGDVLCLKTIVYKRAFVFKQTVFYECMPLLRTLVQLYIHVFSITSIYLTK